MKKLFTTLALLPTIVCAQTFDTATNILTLPLVMVEGTLFNNVKIRLHSFDVISVGGTSPVNTGSTGTAPTSSFSNWYGDWTANYIGTDKGTCSFTVSNYSDSQAHINGICNSDYGYGKLSVSGYIQNNGAFSMTSGATSTGASFSGSFSGNTASGTWSGSYGAGGSVTANKQ